MQIKIGLIVTFVIFSLSINVDAQQVDQPDVNEPTAANFFGVGARAMGMGGAQIAVATDATALVYNPAGLARVPRIEISAGLAYQRFKNRTGYFESTNPYYNNNFSLTNTRLSSANIVLPIPTYRGSFVLALGVNQVRNFDKILDYINPNKQESTNRGEAGGLYDWSFGGAIDLSPQVSMGLTLNYWSGKYEYTLLSDGVYNSNDTSYSYQWNDDITDNYSGYNAKFGARIQPNQVLVIGATIETPVTYTIKESWLELTDNIFYSPFQDSIHESPDEGNSKYKFTLPFSFGLGISASIKNITLATDINYTDWTQMEYKRIAEKSDYNRIIKQVYKDVIRWHIGSEYTIPKIGTSLRVGYYQNPFPFKSAWIKSDRSYFTCGFGLLIDQVTTIDFALVHGSWEIRNLSGDLASKNTVNQIFVSTAYRF